jgi:NAD(P)-dependent dehydrogenase (short-subunit alcohol dehydrogenase family)
VSCACQHQVYIIFIILDAKTHPALQINHLSSAFLTILLLPTLAASAEKHQVKTVLTSISSWSILNSGLFAKNWWKIPKGGLLKNIHDTKPAGRGLEYGHSKVAYLYFLRELCHRLDKGVGSRENIPGSIIVNSVDPGTTRSTVTDAFMSKGPLRVLLNYISRPVELCSRTVVNACIPRDESHGKLFVDLALSP